MHDTKSDSILTGYSDQEKGAYLGAIASLATADRSASQDELDHLEGLCEAAELSSSQLDAVVRAATELSGEELTRCLDILKKSDLRFSLVADLIAFAEIDNDFSAEERANVEKITKYLEVDKTQFSLLDQFVQRTSQAGKTPEEIARPGFLDSLGLKDQFSKAGINVNSASRGLLGMLGPMVLAGMVSKGLRGRSGFPRSNTGPAGLGMPGKGFGGLGSIFSALNGRNRSSTAGMGGLLGRILR